MSAVPAAASESAAREARPPQDDLPDVEVVHLGDLGGDGKLEVKGPISPFLLQDLEEDATQLAASVQHMMGGLKTNLHALSQICGQYMDAHKLAVENIGGTVDESIDEMSSLIVRCTQISDSMEIVGDIVAQIKTAKRTLEGLEGAVNSHPRP